jgi:hypothetical protein
MARGSGKFGISVSSRGRGRGGFRGGYRGNFRGRGRGRGAWVAGNGPAPVRADDATQLEDKFENVRQRDEIDEKLGFHRVSDGPKREGWMVNMHPVSYASFTVLNIAKTYSTLDTNEVGRLAVGTRRCRLLLYSGRRWHVQGHSATRAILLYCLQGILIQRTGTIIDLFLPCSMALKPRSKNGS